MCKHMHLGLAITSSYYSSSETGNVEIEKVEKEKDLDVVIDNKLNFRQHIHVSSKVTTANRNLGIMFITFTYLLHVMFLSLYKSMV